MALTIYIVFLALAVGGRIAMQYQITGDHGVRPVKPTSLPIAILSSVLLVTSFITTFAITCLDVFEIIQPQINLGVYGNIVGVVLCISGIMVTVFSQYQMGAAWRIGVDESEKTELVTNGIYSCIRNPIYSGVMLFGVGLFMLIPNIYMLLCLSIGYLSIEVHVRYVEEPHLHRLHGATYTNYVNHVGRYLPRLIHDHKVL